MNKIMNIAKGILKNNKFNVFLAILLNVIFSIFVIFYAEMFRIFFDNAQNGVIKANYLYLIIIVAVIVIQTVTHYYANIVTQNIYTSMKKELQRITIMSFIQKDQKSIEKYTSGQLLNNVISDVETIAKLSSFTLIKFLQISFKTTIFIFYLLYINIYLGLLSIAISPIMLLLAKHFSKKIKSRSQEFSTQNAIATSKISETLQMISFLRSNKSENYVNEEVVREIEILLTLAKKSFKISLIYDELSSAFGQLANVSILFLGAILIAFEKLSTGELVAFMQILNQVIWPLVSLSSIYGTMQSGLGKAKNIDSVLSIKNHEFNMNFAQNSKPAIDFNNVSFGYDENIINNLSFELPHKGLIIIKGKNGSGKTTLSKLLAGLYLPVEGTISYSNTLKSCNVVNPIAIAYQKPIIISGKVNNNFRYVESVDFERVDKLFKKFNLNFSEGLDEEILFNGDNISGGQGRKISLIRTLSTKKDVIILDEPFSNLDVEAVEVLKKEILEIKESKLLILIDHGCVLDSQSDKIIDLG